MITRESSEPVVSQGIRDQVAASIVHEDDDMLVVNKASGMAVHSGTGLAWGLIDAVRQLRPEKSIELVHRIDRETSGCLILACNGSTLGHLSEQFRKGQVKKRYLCLLTGKLPQAVVEVNAPILADQKGGEKHMRIDESGRHAVTRFTCLHQYAGACYASADIETGRTHQIRVHAQSIGMALAGDKRYAKASQLRMWRKLGLRRLFLHAAELTITTNSGEQMTFGAPLPEALKRTLERLADSNTNNLSDAPE